MCLDTSDISLPDMSKCVQKYDLIYGEHVSLSVLQNRSREIFKIYMTPKRMESFPRNLMTQYDDKIEILDPHQLDKMVRRDDKHQGIILKVGDLIEKVEFVKFLAQNKEERVFGIALDQVQDPHNVGAIIRSAACFGIDFIGICEHGAPRINSTIARSSAGFSEVVPIYVFVNLLHLIDKIRKAGFWIIGFDSNTTNNDKLGDILDQYEKVLFVFGSEGSGMRKIIKDNCDFIVKIPMVDNVDSLNVSNASAIVAYESFLSKKGRK